MIESVGEPPLTTNPATRPRISPASLPSYEHRDLLPLCGPELGKSGDGKERGKKEDVLGEGSAFDEFGYWMDSAAQMTRKGDTLRSKSGTFMMVCLGKETL